MEGKLFRTSVGGYNKKDVHDCIEELNGRLRTLQNEAKAGEKTLMEARQRAEELERREADITAERAQFERRIAELEQQLQTVTAEKTRLSESFDAVRRVNGEYTAKISERERTCAALREKLDQFDRARATAEDILLKAKKEADDIVDTAITSANEIKTKLINEIRDCQDVFENVKQQVNYARRETLKNIEAARCAMLQMDGFLDKIAVDSLLCRDPGTIALTKQDLPDKEI